MIDLSDAYVTGLLPDIEADIEKLDHELAASGERAKRIDAELSALLLRMDESKRTAETRRRKAEALTGKTTAANSRISSLHQEIAALKKRAGDLKEQVGLSDDDEVRARLRRERARALIQIEDREADVAKATSEAESARAELTGIDAELTLDKEKTRLLLHELDQLQDQLPRPDLYLQLFETHAARAHCRLWLDHDTAAFFRELRVAISYVSDLHQALRAGKYRLDKNSDVLGGRATASVEALYGAALLGDTELVQTLFASIADPALLFDQIFNVFRLWCLGLYANDQKDELAALLRRHQYSQGLRAGYTEGFAGLLSGDVRRINAGLKMIAQAEWKTWQDPRLVRGAGVVSIAATTLARFAVEEGLAVKLPGPTVPVVLVNNRRDANAITPSFPAR